MRSSLQAIVATTFFCLPLLAQGLPNAKPLTIEGDIASKLVDGVDKFLLRELGRSVEQREQYWNRDLNSPKAYEQSIEPQRHELARMIGVRGDLVSFESPSIIATLDEAQNLLPTDGIISAQIRWPVVVSLHGEGVLFAPKDEHKANALLVPDADQAPEEWTGHATSLAQAGCRVIVLRTVSRKRGRRRGRADLTNREYLHRSAFEMGRTLIGYETHMALAAVNWFATSEPDKPIGLLGHGEGGMAALFAGAIDTRIDVTCVSGFFGPREESWKEPLDRNVFGLLEKFGAAELACMIAPRKFIVASTPGPRMKLKGRGGAPADLVSVPANAATSELQRAKKLVGKLEWVPQQAGAKDHGLQAFGKSLGLEQPLSSLSPETKTESTRSPKQAEIELIEQIDRHTQWLLNQSPFVRKEFMKNLDTSSVGAYEKSIDPYRKHFAEKTIGTFDRELLPFNARLRHKYDRPNWTGHEVVLDVFPDVIAYGILLLPKDTKAQERRPVIVCQHGLEGRPTDVIEGDHRAYNDFAAKLCERGYIVFAPQNLYIFQDRFRTLQRKANPLGKTLFSIIVPQHQQIVNWLKTLPNVDSERIAFYGLSYGGKSAMRIPPLVTDYCLSICSADFNEWVRKNASTRHDFSYVWSGEYEIFEFDLGTTFNYAEMAALIAPRPFMVERGHFDGVGKDEWVAYEFAKVRNLYAARLKIPERCEIEWFDGPHTINGKATFEFLDRHLDWQAPSEN